MSLLSQERAAPTFFVCFRPRALRLPQPHVVKAPEFRPVATVFCASVRLGRIRYIAIPRYLQQQLGPENGKLILHLSLYLSCSTLLLPTALPDCLHRCCRHIWKLSKSFQSPEP